MELTKEQQVLQQVINEAWESESFKKELMSSPKEAIEKLTGEKLVLPEGKKLIVRDQTDETKIYINIPASPEFDIELNEEELEKVAGGCQQGLNSGRTTDLHRPGNSLGDLIKKY